MAAISPTILALAWAVTLAHFTGSDEVNFDLTGSEDYSVSKPIQLRLPYNGTVQAALETVEQIIRSAADTKSDGQQTLLAIHRRGPQPDHLSSWSDRSKQAVVFCDLTSKDGLAIQGWAEDAWTCTQMVSQMSHLVGLIKQGPGDAPVTAITSGIHSEDLRRIRGWNSNELVRHDICIHEQIRRQSESRGEEIAVCAWDGSFTYNELERLSTQYAARLQAQGVETETCVPLCFTKSRWANVAVLAVLKAGGAFVLLDPAHPPSRLQTICHDVGAKLVISSPRDAHISRSLNLPILEVGPDTPVTDIELKPVTVQPHNAAYVCFTSGSTGSPKGAIIEHRMVSTVAASWGVFLDSRSRVFQFSAYAFDVATFDALAALMYGGCVCVPSEASRRDDIAGAFAALRANVLFTTPSVLQTLSPADMPGLEIALIGGETPVKALLDQWIPFVKVFNVYGPAECAVGVANHGPLAIPYNPRAFNRKMGCHIWLADIRNPDQLAPVGAVGEIVIEGPTVARGYINVTGTKAAAFIPFCPWVPDSQERHRAYRTGDHGRYIDSDGSIEFIGRKDTQVKIRGQRVELSDVEHHLRRLYPGVHHVVAEVAIPAARKGAHPLLAAFVNENNTNERSSNENGIPDSSSLLLPPCGPFLLDWLDRVRPVMQASLPSYMVPTLALPISRMPLTPTGKTDRRQLRAIVEQLPMTDFESYSTGSGVTGRVKQQPDSDMGRSIQAAVAEILSLQPQLIGMEDDFIQLGGDSITAMKLAALLRQSQISLSVVDIIRYPVLTAMAERAVYFTNGSSDNRPEAAPLFTMFPGTSAEIASKLGVMETDILDILPATEQQLIMLAFPPQYEIIHIPGPVEASRLESACNSVVCRHEILRTVFIDYCNSVFQAILGKVATTFKHHECTPGDLKEFQSRLLKEDSDQFMPWNVPSICFFLLSQDPQRYTLIVRLNHAVYDAQSLPIILQDIENIYSGQSLSPPVPFSPWAYKFLTSATSETYEFWKTLLEGSSMTYVGDPFADMEAGKETFVEATRSFPALEPPKGVTLASMVKAAWSLTLSKHCQRSDVVFGQVVHGRARGLPGEEAVVGPCLNLIPVRMDLSAIEHGEDLLHCIHKQNVASIAYDQVQFKDIIKNSTNWPNDTVFGTQLLHQAGGPICALKFGSMHATLDEYYAPRLAKELRDFVVMSTVYDQTHTLQIYATNAYLDQQSADSMMDTLAFYVRELARDPRAISGVYKN
ncbi:nonribosomal peptide synthase [Trichophyton tonsurans CBS 112818]|uniref:Nonribosomal peptide synthase n=1 Tax=Trichophyton tonsurans (strain CBS 112818) TaxID=647933 RepID=F2RT51_TRIT1|nr:nonribosomal peptide synthase [Trichophyton tonsurans CBS 112818]